MIRVVLDTNVVVSGLLSPSGPPGRIIDLLTHHLIQVVYSDEILIEYADVLRRRELNILPEKVETVLEEIRGRGTAVTTGQWAVPVPDGSDSVFLAAALAGHAMVITGNLRHYPANVGLGVDVLSPRAFVDRYVATLVPLSMRPGDFT